MFDTLYLIGFALAAVYFAVILHSYRVSRKPRRRSLAQRVAPYRGGYIARSQPEPHTGETLVRRWQRLRAMAPPQAQPLITSLEQDHLLAEAMLSLHERVHPFGGEDERPVAPVLPLHGHSVRVG